MADEKARQTENRLDLSDLPEIFEPEERQQAVSAEPSAPGRTRAVVADKRPTPTKQAPEKPTEPAADDKSQAADSVYADAARTTAIPLPVRVDADSARTTAIPIPPSALASSAGSDDPDERPADPPTTALPVPEPSPRPERDWESRPTTQIPVIHEPIPTQHFQALPPRPPVADPATAQANRKLAWLLAGVVAVAGGVLIGFLRANTPPDIPVPLVTPQPPADEQNASDALSQPLLTTPTPTSPPAPPPPVAAPPVPVKATPKPVVRQVRPRVPVRATTTKPTTKPTTTKQSDSGSSSKDSKKDKNDKSSKKRDSKDN
jgi:hypothetical protein